MDKCIDSFGDMKVFTILDANCRYRQVKIPEKDSDKTRFTGHAGLVPSFPMQFGSPKALATFQRSLNILLSNVRCQTALFYIDDVFIYFR